MCLILSKFIYSAIFGADLVVITLNIDAFGGVFHVGLFCVFSFD